MWKRDSSEFNVLVTEILLHILQQMFKASFPFREFSVVFLPFVAVEE
jgi:hypothetical protein